MSLIQFLDKRGYPEGWRSTFEKARPQIEHASRMLEQLGEFYPLLQDVFRAFDLCPLENVKCVIVGQDPYHNLGPGGLPQANGLCFSCRGRIQPSLANIYQELKREYADDFVIPENADLSGWALQGVLLLNTCLTVKPGKPGSHGMIWAGFITCVLRDIAEVNPKCIYLLWGVEAYRLAPTIPNSSIKLRASHPSPYSAGKGRGSEMPAFNACGHFKKVNEYLKEQGKTEILWSYNAS